jgi:hypothetical protein
VGERQAKVRPEFGMWHPELSAESGYPAMGMREAVMWMREAVMVELCHGQRSEPQGRMLGDQHLEFRDGQGARGFGQRSRQKKFASLEQAAGAPGSERQLHA